MTANVVVITMTFEFSEPNLNVRGNIMEKVPAPPMATHSEMNTILKLCVIRPTLGTPASIPIMQMICLIGT